MIVRTLLFYVFFLLLFALAVRSGFVKYQNSKNMDDYVVKAERYVYADTLSDSTIVMVGTSLSAHYDINCKNRCRFINLSMTGRSALDGLELIKRSGRLPNTLLIEANLFDNPIDSSIERNLFFPGVATIKEKAFFLQKEYKLHNLLSDDFFTLPSKILGLVAKYSGLYSEKQNVLMKRAGYDVNTKIKEDFIRNKNITYHSTLTDTADIFRRYIFLYQQIQYFERQGVQVAMFKTPVVNTIYNSNRSKYKNELLEKLSNQLSILYLQVPDNELYQPFLTKGDGIHMNHDGLVAYQRFLNDSLSVVLARP
jgi:hypothetical protein